MIHTNTDERNRLSLTFEEAEAALDAVVAEHGPDTVYWRVFGTPKNFDWSGKPCCIAGQVYSVSGGFGDADVTAYPIDRAKVSALVEQYGYLKVDPYTEMLLGLAQRLQDTGRTWGDAVRLAKRGVHLYRVITSVA